MNSTALRGYLGASTEIALVNGSTCRLGDIATAWSKGVIHYTYGHNESGLGLVHWADVVFPRLAMHERQKVVAVRLDNGNEIICTPRQGFLTSDGVWKEASSLKPGQPLKTVSDVRSWTWKSSPVDLDAVYGASRYVSEVIPVAEPSEVFEFKLGKGSSFAHSSGVFLRR
jgi:intein/homing endonuclease